MSSSSPASSGPPPPPPPGATSGGESSPGPNAPPASAGNLYLVTFLATLFLLLVISCAIILRSYILRRRYQRHLQGALGAGMLLTPRSPGSRHARFGHTPKLFDSWLINGGGKWKEMRPVAAQPVFVKKRRRDSVVLKSGRPTPTTSESSSTHSTHRVRTLLSRLRRPQDTTPTHSSDDIQPFTQSQYPPPASTCKNRVEMLQISVLIAMPSQIRTLRKNALVDSDFPEDDDEAPLPELVLGINRIHYRHSVSESKPTPQLISSSPSDIPAS